MNLSDKSMAQEYSRCLNDRELNCFLHDSDIEQHEETLSHLGSCENCRESLSILVDFESQGKPSLPLALHTRALRQVRKRHRQEQLMRIWRQGWVWFGALWVSVGLSFAFPRYYKQFLVLSLVFGIKWILDSRKSHLHMTYVSQQASSDSRSTHSRNAGI